MMSPVVSALSGGSIASVTALAVASITNPTELGSRAGTVTGELCVAYQQVLNANAYTIYFWDTAVASGANSPYIVAGSSGYWIAAGGQYVNTSINGTNALNILGVSTLAATTVSTLTATSTSFLTGLTTIGPNSGAASTQNLLTLQNNNAGTCLRLLTNTGTIYNWVVGSNFQNANEYEITPSTAVGGSTFTVPAFRIAGAAGGTLTIPRPVSMTSTLAVTGIASFNNTTDASAIGTASVVLAGGLSVGKSAFIGTASITTGLTVVAGTTAASYSVSDAGTANTPQVYIIDHTSSNAAAAGFGSRFRFNAKSDTTASRGQANINASWVVATDASRTARVTIEAFDAASARECIRFESSGSAAMVGLYATAATIQYATTGTATGFTAGAGTTATHLSTFTGNTGATAYTVGDIVRALKLLGAIAA